MRALIGRLNRWYDGLPYGPRFGLFMGLMTIAITLYSVGSYLGWHPLVFFSGLIVMSAWGITRYLKWS